MYQYKDAHINGFVGHLPFSNVLAKRFQYHELCYKNYTPCVGEGC